VLSAITTVFGSATICRRAARFGVSPTMPRSCASEKSGPPRLSLVVLPFANLGGDPEQEYFVDGVTESLTTDLSRISGSFVIGRNTAGTYKGKAADLKQIGRELNVRHVVEGSVQRSGGRLRVNVQLIDAETGAHLWAERFDEPLADLFDMRDEIVARLANQLGAQLIAAEARRTERAPHLDSMDLYFQGMACVNKGSTAEYVTQASGFFERALARDPTNIDALVGTAFVNYLHCITNLTDNPAAVLAAAEAARRCPLEFTAPLWPPTPYFQLVTFLLSILPKAFSWRGKTKTLVCFPATNTYTLDKPIDLLA
jgi:TolB-like protein